MAVKLNINQVMQYLPHRYPFLFVDAVEDVVPGQHIRATKNVSVNEAMFNGHFDNRWSRRHPGRGHGASGGLARLLSGEKLTTPSRSTSRRSTTVSSADRSSPATS
jgi:hypothetical protein